MTAATSRGLAEQNATAVQAILDEMDPGGWRTDHHLLAITGGPVTLILHLDGSVAIDYPEPGLIWLQVRLDSGATPETIAAVALALRTRVEGGR